MSIELILGFIAAAVAAITAAFGLGHSRGKNKAEQAATERENKQEIEASQAASRRQGEITKEASDVQDNITRMPDRAVDDELRNDWLNK
ncbi:hypothetical protein CHU32_09710 [Superficieibacter electus]|uniref:DUF2681 domain-containing protein n=1 Tax=Superficieibacter electus TaxID=2022662 RepID=A0A2P5GQL8_9ENTR|nr:hypothetical protein [Superficieibacter electus]POP43346.1 hypothetical protein CHU33_15825 [Superficieibacter electus]POP48863.1 hypothetical protein CHU32_09710 [Superficieibacter electus]